MWANESLKSSWLSLLTFLELGLKTAVCLLWWNYSSFLLSCLEDLLACQEKTVGEAVLTLLGCLHSSAFWHRRHRELASPGFFSLVFHNPTFWVRKLSIWWSSLILISSEWINTQNPYQSSSVLMLEISLSSTIVENKHDKWTRWMTTFRTACSHHAPHYLPLKHG